MGVEAISPYVFEVVGRARYAQRVQVKEELQLMRDILIVADKLEPHRRMLCLDVMARELPAFLDKIEEML